MATTILDHELEERLIAERQASGLDRFDEVWDGVYIMSPWPNDEHQEIAVFLARVLFELIQEERRGKVRQGVNLTDHPEDWRKNYRVPDVIVFLKDGRGIRHGAFWTGRPDFVVEIVSPGEDPEAKIAFYAGLGTRELLLVHRDPWRLELFGPEANGMRLLQSSVVDEPGVASLVVGLKFRFAEGEGGIDMHAAHADGRTWTLFIEPDNA